ncbi:MAG: hypothetical protein J6T10_28825 [Methanobrevibacter sp.]|nr:hypothetical protein [Methanobrevibacter sp.]
MIKINNKDFDKRLLELGNLKFSDLRTWREIAEILSEEFNYDSGLTDDYCRKRYNRLLKDAFDSIKDTPVSTIDIQNNDRGYVKEITDEDKILHKIKKERVKLTDELVQNNAYIRQLAREETLKEIAREYAEVMYKGKILSTDYYTRVFSKNSAILQLSDWHYGIEVDNYWNKFDPETCIKRVNKLQEEVIRKCKDKINTLHIVNLSDLISGYIHLSLRLQNRYDVVTQTMDVAEILAEFINNLSAYFNIEYYDCLDNHSRLDPNKKDAINLESLVRIIHWYLVERFKNSSRIIIHNSDKYGGDIVEFNCAGHLIAGVHGDNDTLQNVVERISLMTGRTYDLILTAHNHSFAAGEDTNCIVLQNGSLMGTDFYATKLRKKSTPSQNLIIVAPDNVIDSIHRIVLD